MDAGRSEAQRAYMLDGVNEVTKLTAEIKNVPKECKKYTVYVRVRGCCQQRLLLH